MIVALLRSGAARPGTNLAGGRPPTRAPTRRHTEIMTAPPSPTRPDDTTRKTDLNLTHVAAAALAAVTSAVLGSELGAAGTLIGAAGASVITTVGTALYQASLERSRNRVRTLAQRARPLPTSREGAEIPFRDGSRVDSSQPSSHSRRFSTLRWGAAVVGALGAFLLAMLAITGFEWINGHSVGGNGKGTTIGQVIDDQPSPRTSVTPPASTSPSTPASETPTETTETPDTATSTSSPDDAGNGRRSTRSSSRPAPSEVTQTPPPLIPLPGIGG